MFFVLHNVPPIVCPTFGVHFTFYRNTPGIDENTPAFSRFVIPKFVFCWFFATFVKNVVCIQEKFFRRIMTISLNIAK